MMDIGLIVAACEAWKRKNAGEGMHGKPSQ